MTEIFDTLPISFKKNAQFLIDLAFSQPNFLESIKTIENFSKQCTSELEKDFINFCLQTRWEKEYESNND